MTTVDLTGRLGPRCPECERRMERRFPLVGPDLGIGVRVALERFECDCGVAAVGAPYLGDFHVRWNGAVAVQRA